MLVDSKNTMTTAAMPAKSTSDEDDSTREERIKVALLRRRAELASERAETLAVLRLYGGVSAGDDAADLGSRTLAREQEWVMLSTIETRLDQVDRALARLASGNYGWCEWCSKEIPVARLAACPAATRCVRCKQLEERR